MKVSRPSPYPPPWWKIRNDAISAPMNPPPWVVSFVSGFDT